MELMVKEGNGRFLEREVAQEMRFEDFFFMRYRLPRTAGGGSGVVVAATVERSYFQRLCHAAPRKYPASKVR